MKRLIEECMFNERITGYKPGQLSLDSACTEAIRLMKVPPIFSKYDWSKLTSADRELFANMTPGKATWDVRKLVDAASGTGDHVFGPAWGGDALGSFQDRDEAALDQMCWG
jgi:hypothetical protein